MYLFMTGATKAHEVLFVIGSSLGERNDVVNFLDGNVASFLQALFTKRMLVNVAVTDSFPCSAVPLAGGVTARELLIVLLHNLGMLLAKPVRCLTQVPVCFIAEVEPVAITKGN